MTEPRARHAKAHDLPRLDLEQLTDLLEVKTSGWVGRCNGFDLPRIAARFVFSTDWLGWSVNARRGFRCFRVLPSWSYDRVNLPTLGARDVAGAQEADFDARGSKRRAATRARMRAVHHGRAV